MRKVRTASGAVAVQVARKDRGRVVIVAHVGSARTDAELGILLDEARQIVAGEQEALDIEVPVRPARVQDVPDWRTSTLIPSPPVAQGEPVTSGRTAATSSRLLYDLLGAVYDWLGFGAADDPVFRDLVIARIAEPTSKLDSLRVLCDLGAELVSYKTIDRHVRKIHAGGHRDAIAAKCFDYASNCGGLSLLLYDVTTLLCRRRHNSVDTSYSTRLAGPSCAWAAHAVESACRKAGLANTGRRRFSVGYDTATTPVSSTTRSESALLVGSMIRANTN